METTTTSPTPLTYTVPQYCRLIGISLTTGRQPARKVEMPTIHVGKRRRIRAWALGQIAQPTNGGVK
jgi:hypothetical protein